VLLFLCTVQVATSTLLSRVWDTRSTVNLQTVSSDG